MAGGTTILVADDHPLFRDALASALSGLAGDCPVELAGTFDDALGALERNGSPDMVLLDLNMPGSRGLSGLSQLRSRFPAVPVVIVSATEDATTIRRSIAMGAAGYVPKSSSIDQIRAALGQILEGMVYVPDGIVLEQGGDGAEEELLRKLQSLTPQQSRVLGMLAEGLLNKQIAYELDVSEATVKAHVSAILLKLDVDSRTQAVILLNNLTGIPGDGDALIE